MRDAAVSQDPTRGTEPRYIPGMLLGCKFEVPLGFNGFGKQKTDQTPEGKKLPYAWLPKTEPWRGLPRAIT
eukprot:11801137-Prorocentrum_lima.AAC.1